MVPVFVEEEDRIVVITVYTFYSQEAAIRMRYDPETDALYVEFKHTTVTTKRLDQEVAIDYDAQGRIADIEILSARERLFPGGLPQVFLENLEATHTGK